LTHEEIGRTDKRPDDADTLEAVKRLIRSPAEGEA
jgi:hypothetical protein